MKSTKRNAHTLKTPKTPKPLVRAQSMFGYDDMELEESLKERDDRIRELEEIIAKQADMMKELQNQGKNRSETTEQNGPEATELNGDNHREDQDQEDINENNNDNESLES